MFLSIKNGLTLIHMPRLLTNTEFRDHCLERVTDASIVELLSGVAPRPLRPLGEGSVLAAGERAEQDRRPMLGQKANHLDFRAIIREGKVPLLDLGRSDGETNRLIGSLVGTGSEMAMRRRRNRKLWNLTIDEFAGYVANEGSIKTLVLRLRSGQARLFRGTQVPDEHDRGPPGSVPAYAPDAGGAFERPDQCHLRDWLS